MKKQLILKFRQIDRDVFLAVKNGKKKIETRAATKKYMKIEKGDELVFVCGNSRFKKQVFNTEHFNSISALVKKYKPNAINPSINSKEDLIKMYYKYPDYKEKIKKYGIVAWKLS